MKKKPKLKFEKKTIFEVSYRALEEFVQALYPKMKDYSFVAAEECSNDSSHPFTVPNKFAGDDWQEEWEKYKQGKVGEYGYNNYIMLDGLLADGKIEAGEYYIEVCW